MAERHDPDHDDRPDRERLEVLRSRWLPREQTGRTEHATNPWLVEETQTAGEEAPDAAPAAPHRPGEGASRWIVAPHVADGDAP